MNKSSEKAAVLAQEYQAIIARKQEGFWARSSDYHRAIEIESEMHALGFIRGKRQWIAEEEIGEGPGVATRNTDLHG